MIIKKFIEKVPKKYFFYFFKIITFIQKELSTKIIKQLLINLYIIYEINNIN